MSDNNSTPRPFRVGLTHGDINGTSYEVILKAFKDTRMMSTMTPILYGQSKALSYYKKNFGMDDFNYSLTRDARQSWNQKFNILNIIDQELKIEPGTATEVSAEMAVLSHKKATEDLRDGYIDALVTAPAYRPIERSNMEYLFSFYKDSETLRVMVNDLMRVGLVTDDVPLRDAIAQIDPKRIAHKLLAFSNALKSDFNLTSPKIAVLGLDPYAGETKDEKDLVTAAVTVMRDKGVFAFGPFSASRLFESGQWRKYDGVLAMYHEQACLPIKLLTSEGCACYWAGLPVLCTAPLQGPEFDIANTNKADPGAFRRAVYLAYDILNWRNNK